jgi:predicted ATPase
MTDIENSSGHWEREPEAMRVALAAHDAMAAQTVRDHDGVVVKHLGDGCWAAFSSAPDAAAAAIDFQRRHQREAPEAGLRLNVRIGLHSGDIEPTEGDYFGPMVNRATRVVELANGNQIVCSASAAGLLPDAELRSEGFHELRGIGSEEVFMVLADGIQTDDEPLRRPIRPTNLPRTHTSFRGRDDEVALATAFIEQHETLVTLVGPGGVGKTRLAVEIGAGLSVSFRQRVYFCDLVPIANGNSDAVAEAVAEVVGARRQPGMGLVDSIADYLSEHRALIILDNCEHVLGAVRQMVERLVEVDGVHILATTREALGLLLEQQLIVNPLPSATAGVELFVDRAKHRDPQFELTPDNEAAVREVVHCLDGLPLAIELAAARIRLMTPADLARGLEDGFRILGDRAASDRHDTLRETVRWSYELLPRAEGELFTRLSVFAGGFNLDAVEAVCADDEVVVAQEILDLMMALVDKSMVVSVPIDGRQRFTLLETLRSFAGEQLTEPGFRRRHADFYGSLALLQSERFFSAAEPDAWRIFDAEWTNLRTALDTFEAEGDLDHGADVVVALTWYANTSMRFEVFTWAEELLAAPGIEQHRAYTDLCGAAALGAYFTVHGDPTSRAEAGLAANPADPQGFCRTALAAVAMNNDQDAAAADAVTRAWLASDPSTVGSRLWAEGFRTFYLCAYEPTPEAADHAEALTRLANETGSITAQAITAWARGQVVSFDDMSQAMEIWAGGLEWTRSLPGHHLVEQLLDGLIIHFAVRRGELSDSLLRCRDAVRGALDRHYHAGTSHLFGVSATALCRAGDAPTGARLVGAMLANGHQVRPEHRRPLEDALGDDLERHLADGAALGITQAGHLAIDALESAVARVENSV